MRASLVDLTDEEAGVGETGVRGRRDAEPLLDVLKAAVSVTAVASVSGLDHRWRRHVVEQPCNLSAEGEGVLAT